MNPTQDPQDLDRWARLRFAIIGPLLAAPPPSGELRQALRTLALKHWNHPVTNLPVQFSFATLERWYYAARTAHDPVSVLRRRRRTDAGRTRKLPVRLIQALREQYQAHPSWTVQLHYENLAAQAAEDESLGSLPSYGTLRRYMKAQGLRRSRRRRNTPGVKQAECQLQNRETRSFEVEHTMALWHLDFHYGSRKVLTRTGQWTTPLLLGVIDDHSRLICHLQWYLEQTTEVLVHGLSQAFQKRGLPRALMTDNGAAMLADEFRQGLHALGILHKTTLPYHPQQNAKQESFWATLEGRLMAMLEGVAELTLERLNEITLVWVEQDYHQREHNEIGTSPLRRYLDSPHVGRECPHSDALRRAFRCTAKRRQRHSDGTISLAGIRFEIPACYHHLEQLHVRYARWDMSAVELIDPHTLDHLAPLYPLDKAANASAQRRRLDTETVDQPITEVNTNTALPPLLRKLMAEYAATGRPPAYLPKSSDDTENSA